jgi:hypothetical protein
MALNSRSPKHTSAEPADSIARARCTTTTSPGRGRSGHRRTLPGVLDVACTVNSLCPSLARSAKNDSISPCTSPITSCLLQGPWSHVHTSCERFSHQRRGGLFLRSPNCSGRYSPRIGICKEDREGFLGKGEGVIDFRCEGCDLVGAVVAEIGKRAPGNVYALAF